MQTDTVYYQVTGGEPLEFCRDWRDRTKAGERVFAEFAKAKGGIGFVRVARNRLGGVVFGRGELPPGWRWHRRACADGTEFAKPIVRGAGSVEGKMLQAEIDALPPLLADEEFCDRFGFPTTVECDTGDGGNVTASVCNGFYRATIAWVNPGDSFWIVLPNLAERVGDWEGRGWKVTPNSWTLPDGLIPSSRARYELAIAADKVAREEATLTESHPA